MEKLDRALGNSMLALYGLGTIIGAGIYALIGKIAQNSGATTLWSIILAFVIALFSASAYSRMARLAPKAGGEAEYVFLGLKNRRLSLITGWAVVFTGIVSCAALTRGFVGYFREFADWPPSMIVLLCAVGLTLVASLGVRISIGFCAFFTLIEIGGLLLVCFKGHASMDVFDIHELFNVKKDLIHVDGLVAGAFLAFYAFIGFEDMVNMAEEVKKPQRTIPLAIFVSLALALGLYLLTAAVTLGVLGPEKAGASSAPLAHVYMMSGGDPRIFSVLALFAIVNGALAQIIMSSRVLYGMRHKSHYLQALKTINKRTKTPMTATLFAGGMVLALALFFPIEKLAQAASFVVLIVFALVSLSFLRMTTPSSERAWKVMAAIGLCLNLAFIVARLV